MSTPAIIGSWFTPTARQGLAVLAAVGLTLLASCASAKQRCAVSYEARAAGKYEGRSPEEAQATSFKYYRECYDVCRAALEGPGTLQEIQSTPECIEFHRLSAEANPRAGSESVTEAKAKRDEPPANRGTISLGDAVVAIKRTMAADGWSLVSDAVYEFDHGYIPFALPMKRGLGYNVVLLRKESTPFSAKVKGWGTDTFYFERLQGGPGGVFVLSTQVKMGDSGDTSPQVVVSADGGDQGDVRVLVFSK